MSSSGTIKLTVTASTQTIIVHGALDAVLQPKFDETIAEIDKIKSPDLTLDIQGADFMDSAGAGFIVRILHATTRNQGTFKIIGAAGQPLGLIRTLGIDTRVDVRGAQPAAD